MGMNYDMNPTHPSLGSHHNAGLQQYDVELNGTRDATRRWLSIHSYNFRQAKDAINEYLPVIALFLFASAASIAMGYVYLLSAIEPTSSASFALHDNDAAFVFYNIAMAFVAIIVIVIDVVVICGLFRVSDRHGCWLFLLLVIFSSLIWWPYPTESGMMKSAWDAGCQGFDGGIILHATDWDSGYSSATGLSSAAFPLSLGGMNMRLYEPEYGLYKFAAPGSGPIVTYDFRNETYTIQSGTATQSGSFTDDILAFTKGKWTKYCYPPAVKSIDDQGDVVVQTLGKYGDESRLMVCVRKMSADEAVISAGRILIALEAAQCHSTKYYKCG